MNTLQIEDSELFARTFELSDYLAGSKFLITGATGLIGGMLVRCLLNLQKGIEITCPVRNIEKAKKMFCDIFERVNFVECDLLEYLNGLSSTDIFHYIIHCASPTSGTYMTEHPVDTYEFSILTTQSLLRFAKKQKIKGMVYVSSVEYYGQNMDDRLINENFQGYVNAISDRSSYPMGKRAAEYLCFAYASEYNIPIKIARLTQTFGAGVAINDNRVFAQFARSVVTGTDIVLHTTGESSKPYCYTTDSVSGILTILVKGENGEAYNVANQDTYISIRSMAAFVRNNFNNRIGISYENHPEMGYAPATKLHISSEKLMDLGWRPRYSLFDMYDRLIKGMQNDAK